MEIHCPHCGHSQSADIGVFGSDKKASLTCPACGKSFPVVNPRVETLRPDTTKDNTAALTEDVGVDGRQLRLPPNLEISLKVLEGNEKGTVYAVRKPRVTIGRTNADVIVDDKMSSRVHCEIEVSENAVTLRDLDSTNGTFVEGKPIRTATLTNGSIFKIGGHAFQLVITSKGP